MDRRTFIGAVAAGMIAAPLTASAQTATTVRRIGVLSAGAPPTPAELAAGKRAVARTRLGGGPESARRTTLRQRPSRAPPTLRGGARSAQGGDHRDGRHGTPRWRPRTPRPPYPSSFGTAGDPVRAGLVASLARPGGNITGFSIVGPELDAKRLALLRELVPGLQRVGVLENSTNSVYRAVRKEFEQSVPVTWLAADHYRSRRGRRVGECDRGDGFAGERRRYSYRADGLFYDNRVPLMSAALKYALPTIVAEKVMLEAWRVSLLWDHRCGAVPTLRRICRQNPPRCKTRRSPDRAADQIRARNQPEDREGTRNHRPAVAAAARG